MSRFSTALHGVSHIRGDDTSSSSHDTIMGLILIIIGFVIAKLVVEEIIPKYVGWILFFIVLYVMVEVIG